MKTVRFFIALFALIFATQIFAQSKAADVVKAYYTALDAVDVAAFNKIAAPNFALMTPIAPVPFTTQNWQPLSAGFKQAFPDMKHEVVSWFADGKKIAVQGVFTGTNTGSMQGNPPSGKKATLPFNAIFELDNNGKIASINVQFDNASFMKQLMPDMVSPDQIKKNAWAAYDALNRRDFAAFKQTVVADFVEYTAGPALIKGVDACIEAYKMYFAMFPDLKFDIQKQTIEGDRLIIEAQVTGTNTGMVMGMLPATGKMIKTQDVDVLTIDLKTGKALSHSTANPNEILRQIGYGSLANPNTGIVMAIFEKFQKRDVEGLMGLLDDKLSYDGKSHPIIPKEQVMNGKTEFSAWIKEYNEKIQNVKLMPQRILADGNDVMVSLTVDYILKATGKSYSTNLIQHWRFRDGKAIWLRAIGSKPESIAAVTSKN